MAIKNGGKMQFNQAYSMNAESFLPLLENDSIKMIDIDPPYNTKSKKFEYHDDMRKSNAKHINIIHEYVVVYAKNKMQQTLFVMPNC